MRTPRGIARTADGWRISVRVDKRLWQKRYPPATTLETLQDELVKHRKAQRAGRTPPPAGFAADITRYCTAFFASRPGLEERRRHLTLWTTALGADTPRQTITREDVSRVLETWRAAGLAADTCNKRRTALLAFFHALDGKGATNPVRDVPKFRTPAPIAHGLPYAQIAKAFRLMRRSKTRARLKVMAYTGARPVQIRRITPDDWNDRERTLLLRSTAKGAGTKPYTVPLSHEAQAAMKEFDALEAYGPFASAPFARLWKVAAIQAGCPATVVPYHLRHSFGTQIYRRTKDIRVTKELMGHASIAMTERYTLAAVPERQRAAVQSFIRARRRKLPVKVASRRKRA